MPWPTRPRRSCGRASTNWARPGPVFTGRDKVIHYDFNEIERERRTGYAYLGTWPAKLLAQDYPWWRTNNRLP